MYKVKSLFYKKEYKKLLLSNSISIYEPVDWLQSFFPKIRFLLLGIKYSTFGECLLASNKYIFPIFFFFLTFLSCCYSTYYPSHNIFYSDSLINIILVTLDAIFGRKDNFEINSCQSWKHALWAILDSHFWFVHAI